MHFDVIFLDTTSNKYYDRETLEKQPLGGTEASVVRVAEGLGSLGLKVAVVQSQCPEFEPMMGEYCFFMHSKEIPGMTANHYVQIRNSKNSNLFPKAKKYLWLHDVAGEYLRSWEEIAEFNLELIGVSRWHAKNIRDFTGRDVSYIYNPVPEHIYTPLDKRKGYDKNLLVWMSSPHKGLNKALKTFKTLYEKNNHLKLAVFNPGYYELNPEIELQQGVHIVRSGSTSCHQLWHYVSNALCVFYPTQYKETFGCIAAEANALGTPLVTYRNAGLSESVTGDNQFCRSNKDAVNKVLSWNDGHRPTIFGNDEFKQSNVILKWVKLLAS